jgi:hypothetical protein
MHLTDFKPWESFCSRGNNGFEALLPFLLMRSLKLAEARILIKKGNVTFVTFLLCVGY